jgi:hypothetical protein
MKHTLILLTAGCISLGTAAVGVSAEIDGRDALLAALGKATLDCLGTVGPATYNTSSGVLGRTFTRCRSGDRALLQQVDALLALQFSEPGRADDIAGHYVSRWNAFVRSFPHGHITQCPVWQLENVIDAPTRESVPRIAAGRRIGKENYRYKVSSTQCAHNGGCAIRAARECAGGFGPAFIVDQDPHRSRVEVDPAWWLTTYDFPCEVDNPFQLPGYYHPMSYYGALPGALYGALQRAGEACSQWSETGKHYTDRVLVPIDCGGGWFCMTYCTIPGVSSF